MQLLTLVILIGTIGLSMPAYAFEEPNTPIMNVAPSVLNQANKTVYENGFTLVTLPQNKAKTISVYLAVKAGAADENTWLGHGLSHFVEHMFFKGSRNRKKGEIERQVREMGGYINAYTSHDSTVFYIQTLSKHAENAIDLLYDAALHPILDTLELEKERQVILAEQRMNEDKLSRKALITLWETIFLRHPYKHPVIGYPELFKQVSRDDLAKFVEDYYVPSNLVMSIVGDFDSDSVKGWVGDRFGKAPMKKMPLFLRDNEPQQITPRKRTFYRPAEHIRLFLGFPSVALDDPNAPALDIFSQILGDGPTSRLYTSLKESQQLVIDISASHSNMRDAGIFSVDALITPDKFQDLNKIQTEIMAEINKLLVDGFTIEELQRVKRQILSDHFSQFDSHSNIAHLLVSNEVFTGNPAYSDDYLNQIQALTMEEVLQSARLFIRSNALNTIKLLPSEFESTNAPKQQINEQTLLSQIKKTTMQNGVRILTLKDDSVPLVYFQASFLGGVREEDDSNTGITALMAELLLRGTANYTFEEIMQKVSDWGGDISAYSGLNSFGVTLHCLAEFTDEAAALLGEIMAEPKFDAEELEKVREDQIQSIRAEEEEIYAIASRHLAQTLYHKHPYRLNPLGTEAIVSQITVEDIKAHYKSILRADKSVLAIFGDINSDLPAQIKNLFKNINFSKINLSTPEPEPPITEARFKAVVAPREQAVVMLALQAISVTDPRRYALQLINTVITGSAGRLYTVIRGEHGLSYVVGSGVSYGIEPGHWAWYAAVEKNQVEAVKQLLTDELDKLLKDGITPEELELAKVQLVGNHEKSMESKTSLLVQSVSNELFGLGYEEISEYSKNLSAVTMNEINAAIEQLIHPSKTVIVVVAPGEAD
ncbi:MAG: zinc protease [Candidatus Omnitrophota bacterium]|jgi:zinc protease